MVGAAPGARSRVGGPHRRLGDHGRPEGFDPFDGGLIRRLLRRKLVSARDRLAGNPGALRVLVLVGAYDYMANENAGPSLRGFDPALAAALDIVALVSDAEVKPVVLSRSIPWLNVPDPAP